MAKSKVAAPSILSADLYIYGQIMAEGDIQIDGTIEGDIRSNCVTVGENAKINGELSGDNITIKGRVEGVVRGKRVHLCSTCHVEGDIYHEALAIENGSFFNGSVHRVENPLNDASIQFAEPVAKPITKLDEQALKIDTHHSATLSEVPQQDEANDADNTDEPHSIAS